MEQLERCKVCAREKELSEFPSTRGTGKRKHPRMCFECRNTYNQVKSKKFRTSNRDAALQIQRKSWLKRAYGVSPEQYNELFVDQAGCCAICGLHQAVLEKKLCVDHDHDTGEVRGLLCSACNRGLGMFRDSEDLLNQAEKYLKEHRNECSK